MQHFRIYLYLTIVMITIIQNLYADEVKRIYVFDLKKDIGSTTWLYTQKAFQNADEYNADLVIISLNTYGGEVQFADSIRTKILNYSKPVYVFVDNNAASAGALIALAADRIYMRKGASMGAATVVDQEGKKMPDKYQSYMRATMRATAQAHGKDTLINGNDTVFKWKRDPLIAEAMVDERTVIAGIDDSSKILTFTTQEAIKYNYCEGEAENLTELIENHLLIANYEIKKFSPTTWDNIKGFLMSTVFQGILIMLIIGGIYFELQSPGIGFPLGVAITAAFLYFAPLYMDGLAANWEIIVFVVGILLIAVELLVIPGFGVAGISGIVMVVAGLTLALLNNVNFNFENVPQGAFGKAMFTVISGMTVGFALILYISSKIGMKGFLRRIALTTNLTTSEGYVGVEMPKTELTGLLGQATTVLRPSGKVKIAEVTYDAVSLDGFIEKGESVKVVRYETGQVYVTKEPNFNI